MTMIDPSDETMTLTSMRLAHLHFALLDFILCGNPTNNRSDLTRAAIEQFVTAHENWDLESFLKFAKESYAPAIKKKHLREPFLATLAEFKAQMKHPRESALAFARGSEVASSAEDFDV
jgi:hypothetical protein